MKCLPGITVQSAANNIGSLGNLKLAAGLFMLKMCIITITWIGAYKIKVFMISLENELLTKTRLIMKKKATGENLFGRKANGV